MKKSLAHSAFCAVTCSAVFAIASITPSAHSQIPFGLEESHSNSANVQDIIVQGSGHDLHILIKLDVQPKTAAATLSADGVIVSVKDLYLQTTDIDPPTKPFVSHAVIKPGKSGESSQIIFTTIKLSSVETKIYRNAILISARTFDAIPEQAPAPSTKAKGTQPSSTPQALVNLMPASSLAEQFQLDSSACAQAQQVLKNEPWNLDIMADHALCLVSDNKLEDALQTIMQLESFMPNNWKAALARGEIYRRNGQASQASIQFAYALQYVENREDKQRISVWVSHHS
ncbi:hypothetical protein [Hirschia litorea]|uniref:Tetratricopeptide repeat protein n=1 Tax=Hirschia litorea TaxID=1199156 RepID=A0ABW2IJM4_9PROT